MKNKNGLTLFIPVYNEEDILEKNIKILESYLRKLDVPYEILVVSNGSDDLTVPILNQLTREIPALRFFHLPSKGVGNAYRTGIQKAAYDSFITVDMDLSIDLSFVGTAYRLLSEHHIVVGSKISGIQKRSRIRTFASNAFIFSARVFLGIDYSDYSIAAKGYRTSIANTYLSCVDDHTFYVTRILFRAFHEGKKIIEIPVDCRDVRKSRFNLMHEGLYKFYNLITLGMREKYFLYDHAKKCNYLK
jgi:glycosyltransferase involved in cell wall biosynthesis